MPSSIKYKTAFPVILLALALVSFTGLSIYVMNEVESVTERVAQGYYELEHVHEIEVASSELVFPHLDYLTTINPDAKNQINDIFSRIDHRLATLETMMVDISGNNSGLMEFIKEKIHSAKHISNQILLYNGEHHHSYMRLSYDFSESYLIPLRKQLVSWHQQVSQRVETLNNRAEMLLHNYLVAASVVLTLVVIMIAFTLWYNNNILVKPVLSITKTTSHITQGDFKEKSIVHSDDELGQLAHNINEMAQSLDRMYTRLEIQARTDQLTGVHNRLSMEEVVKHELAVAHKGRSQLSMALIDLDHFKNINDRFGHVVGDKVLQGVVERCLKNIRDCDYCFRYGGEEFLLLFPLTKIDAATIIAERCRKDLEENPLEVDGNSICITVSFGLVNSPQHGIQMEDLINKADQALYAAKNSGRNKIVCYSELVKHNKIAKLVQ